MEVKASLKHLRMSAQKVRLVIDLVRQLPVDKAFDQLQFVNKAAALPISKLLKSAVANAVNTYNLSENNLYIKEIKADEGVTLKRWMPRAQGRATSIRKRGCHINLVLSEIKASAPKAKKTVKAADPVKLGDLAKEAKEATKKTKLATKKTGKAVVSKAISAKKIKK